MVTGCSKNPGQTGSENSQLFNVATSAIAVFGNQVISEHQSVFSSSPPWADLRSSNHQGEIHWRVISCRCVLRPLPYSNSGVPYFLNEDRFGRRCSVWAYVGNDRNYRKFVGVLKRNQPGSWIEGYRGGCFTKNIPALYCQHREYCTCHDAPPRSFAIPCKSQLIQLNRLCQWFFWGPSETFQCARGPGASKSISYTRNS